MQVDDPAMFVFIDESSRGVNEARRRRAWGPRGQENSLKELFSAEKSSYTLLAAADLDGFVVEMTELIERKKSSEDQDDTRGTVDTERFLMWVQEKLCPSLGDALKGEPRSVVVMDNATIHQHPRVKTLIEEKGAVLIYCAAYSPDLNPIEYCFHQYKAALRRNFRCGVGLQDGAHQLAMASVTRDNMCNYYRKIGCIQNIPMLDQTSDEDAFLMFMFMHQAVKKRRF